MYRFQFGTSAAFNAMLEFAYTANIEGAYTLVFALATRTPCELGVSHLHLYHPRVIVCRSRAHVRIPRV